MAKYQILAFDGGGVCGALSAAILQRLAAAYPLLLPNTTTFAGTSTGGLIASLLACGHGAQDAVDLYVNDGAKCFTSSTWRNLTKMWGLAEADYDTAGIEAVLDGVVGDRLLRETNKTLIMPTSLVIGPAAPQIVVMSSYLTNAYCGITIKEADLRTSAAPTYFPIRGVYCDGAMWANSPAGVAVDEIRTQPGNASLTTDDFLIMRFGTGLVPMNLDPEDLDLGAVEWLRYLVPTFLGLQQKLTDTEMRQYFGGRYFCVNPATQKIAIDDVTQIPSLVAAGDAYDLAPAVAYLRGYAW